MMTDELISKLVAEAKPVPCRAMEMRLGKGIVVGGAITLLLVALLLGIRPDIGTASTSAVFWVKIAYGGAYAALGVSLLRQLSRPCTCNSHDIACLAGRQRTACGMAGGRCVCARVCQRLVMHAADRRAVDPADGRDCLGVRRVRPLETESRRRRSWPDCWRPRRGLLQPLLRRGVRNLFVD